MATSQFILVCIDYKNRTFSDDVFITTSLNMLRIGVFTNKSLLISKHTLLVKFNHTDLSNYYQNPKYHLQELFIKWKDTENHNYNFNNINIYCFPINLKDFEDQLSEFNLEIEYLKAT